MRGKMRNTISTLTEKITLLKESHNTGKTTVNRFDEVIKSRASIRSISSDLFEVIMLRPPAKLKKSQFSAIRWNDTDYIYDSPFTEYKGKFLKGRVKFLPNQQQLPETQQD